MSVQDEQYIFRVNDYITTRFELYINWYIESTKISKNNLFAAIVVIFICALCLLFTPNSLDQMSFMQYSFNPTLAIKLGLITSIVLAFSSMFTSYKKMKLLLTKKALLQSQYVLFSERDADYSGLNDETAFARFVYESDCIMAATSPEFATAVAQDNALKPKAREGAET